MFSLRYSPFIKATLGNALTYLYPAMMYSSIVKKQNRKDQATGVFIANCSAVLGVVMGVIGTYCILFLTRLSWGDQTSFPYVRVTH